MYMPTEKKICTERTDFFFGPLELAKRCKLRLQLLWADETDASAATTTTVGVSTYVVCVNTSMHATWSALRIHLKQRHPTLGQLSISSAIPSSSRHISALIHLISKRLKRIIYSKKNPACF